MQTCNTIGRKRTRQCGFMNDCRIHKDGFGCARCDLMDQSRNPDAAQVEVTPNANSCFVTCGFVKQSLNAAIRNPSCPKEQRGVALSQAFETRLKRGEVLDYE